MQRRCCCPPERPSALCRSRSFTSSHSAARRSDGFDDRVQLRAGAVGVDPRAVGDVVVDRLGKAIPALEHHPDPPAQRRRVERRVVDVGAVEQDLARRARVPGSRSCMPVDRAQEGRLAAPRRTDERGDRARPASRGRCRTAPASPHTRRRTSGRPSVRRASERPRRWSRRWRRCGSAAATAVPRLTVVASSEPSGDVGLGARVLGRREQRRWSAPPRPARPCSMNAVRSDTRAACCMLCVTMTTVMSRRSS